MAYAKGVKEFDCECAFRVGERVKIFLDGIPQEDIACETGIIVGVSVKFMHTPEMRRIRIRVRMDAPFLKKTVFGDAGEFLDVDSSQVEKVYTKGV